MTHESSEVTGILNRTFHLGHHPLPKIFIYKILVVGKDFYRITHCNWALGLKKSSDGSAVLVLGRRVQGKPNFSQEGIFPFSPSERNRFQSLL